jgi:hypothetical protein
MVRDLSLITDGKEGYTPSGVPLGETTFHEKPRSDEKSAGTPLTADLDLGGARLDVYHDLATANTSFTNDK